MFYYLHHRSLLNPKYMGEKHKYIAPDKSFSTKMYEIFLILPHYIHGGYSLEAPLLSTRTYVFNKNIQMQIRSFFNVLLIIFFLFFHKNICCWYSIEAVLLLSTYNICFHDTVFLLSTHNICFHDKISRSR